MSALQGAQEQVCTMPSSHPLSCDFEFDASHLHQFLSKSISPPLLSYDSSCYGVQSII